MAKRLTKPSTLDRVPRRSLAEVKEDPPKSDPKGGVFGAGFLPRVSLCTRGEALGHGFWIDGVMLQQIVEQMQALGRIKSRFTHPDLCSDGMGKALGIVTNGVLEGDQALGDLSFYENAHHAPDGDLAGYVLGLQAEDPRAFGLSIVFKHDWEAEDLFVAEHTKQVELKDEAGNVVDTRTEFVSPDPLNTDNLPHARILKLYAADVVDEPAANPDGLYHRGNSLAAAGRSMLDYVLGRSTESPKSSALGIAPERVKEFVTRYLKDQGLSVQPAEMGNTMPKKKSSLMERMKAFFSKLEEEEEEKKDDKSAADDDDKKSEADKDDEDDKSAADDDDEDPPKKEDSEEDPKEDDPKKDDEDEEMRAGLQGFIDMFGTDRGAEYFLAGKSMVDALKAEVLKLRADVKEANRKLAVFAELGVDPVKFNAAPDKKGGEGTPAPAASGAPSNREKFAALNAPTEQKAKKS